MVWWTVKRGLDAFRLYAAGNAGQGARKLADWPVGATGQRVDWREPFGPIGHT